MQRILMLAMVLTAVGCTAEITAPVQSPRAGPAATTTMAVVSGFGAGLNAERARNGRGPLVGSPQLVAAAQAHAQDMATNGYFSHSGRNGSTLRTRAEAAGYRGCTLAENIAAGQPTEAAVLAAWMASSGHRANILNADVTQYGLGRAGDKWVLMFGQPC
jgi:uncharacterized protein YkwD